MTNLFMLAIARRTTEGKSVQHVDHFMNEISQHIDHVHPSGAAIRPDHSLSRGQVTSARHKRRHTRHT